MSDNDARGLESPERQPESPTDCPTCGTPPTAVVTRGTLPTAVVTRGPSAHCLVPCRCRVAHRTVRALADSGRSAAAVERATADRAASPALADRTNLHTAQANLDISDARAGGERR